VVTSEQLLFALRVTASLVVTGAGEVLVPAVWSTLDVAAVARSFGRGALVGAGLAIEVHIHDYAVARLTRDIHAVLSRARY